MIHNANDSYIFYRTMKHLEVLPSLSDISGNQKCYLGPIFMDKIDVNLGQCVKVQTDCCSYLCSAWPRRDRGEGHIQFDPVVICPRVEDEDGLCGKCLTENNPVPQIQISLENVQKVGNKVVNSVNVDVIFEDYRDVSKYKKLKGNDSFRRKVLSVLRKLCVSKGGIVRCQRMKLGKLYKISYITINYIDGERTGGIVTPDTYIIVDNISSKERFKLRLKSSFKKKLGGLDKERAILIETITLPFKYQDAREKFGIQFSRGVLLRGPAGCGKTCLVRSVTSV